MEIFAVILSLLIVGTLFLGRLIEWSYADSAWQRCYGVHETMNKKIKKLVFTIEDSQDLHDKLIDLFEHPTIKES